LDEEEVLPSTALSLFGDNVLCFEYRAASQLLSELFEAICRIRIKHDSDCHHGDSVTAVVDHSDCPGKNPERKVETVSCSSRREVRTIYIQAQAHSLSLSLSLFLSLSVDELPSTETL
jgi:hypothetical protein